jgi:MFS family permease
VRAFDLGILRRPEFILLQGWSYCTIFGYVVLLFTLPSYAQDIGLSSKQGSIVGAVFNLGQMLGRPLVGLASDRWGRLNVATLATFLSAVSCLVFWLPAEVTSNKMAYICTFGVIGTFWGAIAPIGVEVVGIQNLPSALSWTWVLLTIPTTFAEAITLKIRKPGALHWGYLGPELFTAPMYIGAAVCILFLRAWKIGEIEKIEHLQLVEQIGQLENSAHRPRPTIEINKTACWNIRDGLRRIMARRIV